MIKLSRIFTAAILIMAAIVIPLGVSTVMMAFELGLIYEAISCILMMCIFAAFSIYELRELIAEYERDLVREQIEDIFNDGETDNPDDLPF